ncbi:hypothetical protein DPMN_011677 [Dreissena polymorpha]|uniref:MAM domain-containing protein n=1 Tax=Dreissena polymorpha TaxID=45954 RepID=A0A9D4N5K1_DREPO|nr:hypothetical protein DPMN_011677 [Dreissena polymorpha]
MFTAGNQGPAWLVASYSVPATSKPFQIMFEGIVGNSFYGDLAIDDFSLTPGACPYSGRVFAASQAVA